MLEPAGRVAMVSGASRGIGRAVAERLACAGYRISAGLRDPRRAPPEWHACRYDAEEAGGAQAWATATLAEFGRIDVLVNAAGINPMARFLDSDETAFDALMAVNVRAPMRLIRAAWPHLVASGAGRIVNLASLSGKRVRNDNAGYAMAKAALVSLTQAVRREGWEHGIRATAFCPGFVETDMTAHVTKQPRELMSRPEDIAAVIETLVRLPNTASVAELLLNCRHEDML
ncbi:short-chain dehydrogenase [Methylobacterium indicum]|uniref:SDR family NAD(P)-dependent oxidoreductase n=2 Tax=Methylobacterium indicum TaxID=1775910 RepID=UPI000733E81C|nr:SDR family NAD(P)-dependent oxidoreductase [Methylobacterium indicum]KTS20769.1 short-chain dehydrogenase [Methylobacterium indicum]KTS24859.1 short-chain dehydrogenase [Methylobacterium indicum]KTS43964.1 short-chain dehydrogenase [Methylobacterium indicum]